MQCGEGAFGAMTKYSLKKGLLAISSASFGLWVSMTAPLIAGPFSSPDFVDMEDEEALGAHLSEVGAQGRLIFEKDNAAAIATDGLRNHLKGIDQRVRGWVSERQGDGKWRVLFFGDKDTLLHWVDTQDGAITPNGIKSFGSGVPLNNRQRAMVKARTAAANKKFTACTDSYNTVVVDAPEGDFYVYLLAATGDPSLVTIGGHYRRLIDGDTFKVKKTRQYSKGCLILKKEENSAGLISSNAYVSYPEEVHVFVSLLHDMPLYIITSKNGIFWKIADGEVSLVRGN